MVGSQEAGSQPRPASGDQHMWRERLTGSVLAHQGVSPGWYLPPVLCFTPLRPLLTVPPSVRTHPRRHSGEARGCGHLRASPPVPHCRIKGRVEGHRTLKPGWNKSRTCHIRAWGPRASHFIWSSLDFFSHLTMGIVIAPEEDCLEE